jgi:hypothetical protein
MATINGPGLSAARFLQFRGAALLVRLVERVDVSSENPRSRILLLGLYVGTIAAGIGFLAASRRRRRGRSTSHRQDQDLAQPQPRLSVEDLLNGLGYHGITPIDGLGGTTGDFQCRDDQDHAVVVKCLNQTTQAPIEVDEMVAFVDGLAMEHQGARGLFVTTSNFSIPAVELARKHGIALIDRVKPAQTGLR